MSETKHYIGKIRRLHLWPYVTLEDQCQKVANDSGYKELPDRYESWEELIASELYDKYIVVHDRVYKILEANDMGCDFNVFHAHDNNDGTISYEVVYYNGGYSLEDAIEEALDNMNKRDILRGELL